MQTRHLFTFAAGLALAAAKISTSSLENFVDSLSLTSSFNPIKEAYWTGYPHHRRTPFAVSPDGSKAFLAYLDSSGTGVHVQGVDPTTFAAVGTAVSISGGLEAGGLVAHDDGFALLTNEVVSGQADGVGIAVLYRYTNGVKTFRTLLGGPDIDASDSLASPDINGDLVYSEKAGYYAAYIVVTSYSGSASGHFGDAIRYITKAGKLETIAGASSSWGCSHNTGIAFEAADEAPFASLCAEDQGAIWLNTETQGMGNNGVKVSNEHVINGASNEPMGGMSGSYSVLARFIDSDSYIFSWVSRGAIDLTENSWMGAGYTTSQNRTNNRNIAIALFSDKKTLKGSQATSVVGSEDGDSQVNWITEGSNDCSNAHVAAFDGTNALVSWEEISNPICDFDAMGCRGTFAGTKFQLVDSTGAKSGEAISSTDTTVAGDMVTMSDGRICWPYVSMAWSLTGPTTGSAVSKMSFACMSNGSGTGSSASSAAATKSATKSAVASSAAPTKSAAASSAAAVQSTVAAVSSSVKAVEETAETTTSLPSDAPRPTFVTLSESVSNILAAPSSSGVASSGVASSAAAAVTSAAASSAAETTPALQLTDAVTSAITPSVPTTTAMAGDDDEGDCDEEESTSTTSTSTKVSKTKTKTRKTKTRKSSTRTRTAGQASGANNTKVCSAHTVVKTVYVTQTPQAVPHRGY
ncbi:hypothetical protein BGZ61DRAFT_341749 [Ilyonectria robusta]|uniref:uncharacterized protein n=1 Tax=Ilyonectria robusta TaxID=1079257 RepID=UPI001E8D8783|nr:uncharacterized protein BGZ61DRAFT_341749 [Ilyonectria robusta]KAH8734672.1 hypothetical protein BGZ61DRAFT_341749 [Ilyonectria robusta]